MIFTTSSLKGIDSEKMCFDLITASKFCKKMQQPMASTIKLL
jgi:hypothetical protein